MGSAGKGGLCAGARRCGLQTHATDNVERANFGSEITIGQVKLRAGGGVNYDQMKLGFGGGVTQKLGGRNVTIDYAAVTLSPFDLIQSIAFTVGL